MNPSQTIKEVCEALLSGNNKQAREIARADYPFKPITYSKRQWSTYHSTKIFIRDGFIDRYWGQQLVFPATMRLLSTIMPEEFPYHPNWKLSEGHIMYWELSPTLDHIVPIARGGADEESNLVTASWVTNSAKSNWTLAELKGWTLLPKGKFEDWDGLLHWFLEYVENNPEYKSLRFLKSWYTAAKRCLAETSQ